MDELCNDCAEALAGPYTRRPIHLVHPVTNALMVFDIYGRAVCLVCGTFWYRGRSDEVTLLEV